MWLATTKLCSQQVYVTAANLSASLLATVVPASWGLRVETEVIYVGLCYWGTLGLGVTQAYMPSVDNSNYNGIFREKTADTCIRRTRPLPFLFSFLPYFPISVPFFCFIVFHIFRKLCSVDREFS
jgi:hypothetical protein